MHNDGTIVSVIICLDLHLDIACFDLPYENHFVGMCVYYVCLFTNLLSCGSVSSRVCVCVSVCVSLLPLTLVFPCTPPQRLLSSLRRETGGGERNHPYNPYHYRNRCRSSTGNQRDLDKTGHTHTRTDGDGWTDIQRIEIDG